MVMKKVHAVKLNCREMMKRPEEERIKWQEGMQKEFKDFEKRGMWKVMKMRDTPPGRKLMGCKWVHKPKRNGVHRSRLVALGCPQTPGVDHQDNFSGVVHDVTLRIGLVNWIVGNSDADQMDVETAFPEGVLEEKERVHMKCPPGMTLGKDECLVTCKGMHGLVQSARLHWLKMSEILMSPEIGFKKSEADQCSFVKMG